MSKSTSRAKSSYQHVKKSESISVADNVIRFVKKHNLPTVDSIQKLKQKSRKPYGIRSSSVKRLARVPSDRFFIEEEK